MPTTIADIWRGLEERKPKATVNSYGKSFDKPERALGRDGEGVNGGGRSFAPPVSLVAPWIDRAKIAAATARDVLERNEDDRSRAQRSVLGSHFAAVVRAVHKTKRIVKPKAAPKPKVKKERTPELKEYYRNYGRMWRARRKAEMADA
jgi:hypothetical protein